MDACSWAAVFASRGRLGGCVARFYPGNLWRPRWQAESSRSAVIRGSLASQQTPEKGAPRPAWAHHHGHCQPSCSALALNVHSGQTIISDDHLSSGLRRCSNAPFVSPILLLLQSCWEQAHIGSWHHLNLSPCDVRACTQPPQKKSILICCCVPTWRHLQISEFFLQRLFGFILTRFGEVSVPEFLSQSFLSAFIALLLYCQIQPDCVTQLGYFKIVGAPKQS